MSMSAQSLSWGFDPKIEDSSNNINNHKVKDIGFQPHLQSQLHLESRSSALQSTLQSNRIKRKHQDDDEHHSSESFAHRRIIKKAELKYRIGKKDTSTTSSSTSSFTTASTSFPSHKRSRNGQRIVGHRLPIDRMVEILDLKELRTLVSKLNSSHPGISDDIYRFSPKPTVAVTIENLSKKVEAITQALPYKVDSSSEYAFLRVKPLIEEFLHLLSDYTLNFLPPVESQPSISLEFLDQATSLLHQLPNFKKLSNSYLKNMAYERLAETWCSCLKDFIRGSSSSSTSTPSSAGSGSSGSMSWSMFNNSNNLNNINCASSMGMANWPPGLLVLLNNDWETKLNKHNELSGGKMSAIVECLSEEISRLNDELPGMCFPYHLNTPLKSQNLRNFSSVNNPLYSLQNSLLDG